MGGSQVQALDVDAKPHFDHEDYGHHIMRNAWATLAAAADMTVIKTTSLR